MFLHVFERASRCKAFRRVVLATDSRRIAAAAAAHGVPVVMTRADHASGTDRVLEAAERMAVPETAVVVNVQGDEPAIAPAMLTEVLAPFGDRDVQVATLATPMTAEDAQDPDQVKVVLDHRGEALYFSRAPIPHHRDGTGSNHLRHVGLYAFRMAALRRFAALGPGRLEAIEKLEQLRLLENGIAIRVAITRHRSVGVDRPEDIDAVAGMIEAQQKDLIP
jgi:3-deoxy-manno-octulosonate cytidylyltransferase (CMP-KDO synthetase)